jgi:hypothetical protein
MVRQSFFLEPRSEIRVYHLNPAREEKDLGIRNLAAEERFSTGGPCVHRNPVWYRKGADRFLVDQGQRTLKQNFDEAGC